MCTFDPAQGVATVTISTGGSATLTVSGGAIALDSTACGDATVSNTDTIAISAPSGSNESLTIDQSGGAFTPGATAEGAGVSEIEIVTALGDSSDTITVLGTSGNDSIQVGQSGIALDSDGDTDVTFSPTPAAIEVRGQGGVNTLTGSGGPGGTFTGSLTLRAGDSGDSLTGGDGNDTLVGGAGNDNVNGRDGDDTLDGGDGNDRLAGNVGNDAITGGAGADELIGSAGDDTFHAVDGVADTTLSGGPGTDTAYFDSAVDPNPTATENEFPT